MEVPYCIIKGMDRIGKLAGRKKATCACLTSVPDSDKQLFETIRASIMSKFNNSFDEIRKTWGGNIRPQPKQKGPLKRAKKA